jgi:hypothetical protein
MCFTWVVAVVLAQLELTVFLLAVLVVLVCFLLLTAQALGELAVVAVEVTFTMVQLAQVEMAVAVKDKTLLLL